MPELIRSIANRLREFVGNRRRAPRYITHLEAGLALRVSLPNTGSSARTPGKALRLSGYTRDISETGLAIIVPTIRIEGQYITNDNRTLRIMLKLPTGPVEILAKPVRYSPLEDDAKDTGYLVGVQITGMSDDDRARFNAYIQTLTRKTEVRSQKSAARMDKAANRF
ncbi:MAG TPA: PilZ domain-containing protein [Pyrinomonadaceae bacterium]